MHVKPERPRYVVHRWVNSRYHFASFLVSTLSPLPISQSPSVASTFFLTRFQFIMAATFPGRQSDTLPFAETPCAPTFRHATVDRQAQRVVQHLTHPLYTVRSRWRRQEKWTHWCEGFYPRHLLAAAQTALGWERARSTLTGLRPRASTGAGFLFMVAAQWQPGEEKPKGIDQAGPDPAAAGRRLPGITVGQSRCSSTYDERRHHPLGGQCHERFGTAGDCSGALPDHAAPLSGASGWWDGSRGHLRRADRPVPARKYASGVSPRQYGRGLAWADLRFHSGTSVERRRRIPGHRTAYCRVLRHAPRKGWCRPGILNDGTQPWKWLRRRSTASGLWDLAEQTPDAAEKVRYRLAALTILETCVRHNFCRGSSRNGRACCCTGFIISASNWASMSQPGIIFSWRR